MAASLEGVRRTPRAVASGAFAILALLAILGGRLPLLGFVSAVIVLAYLELRRLLVPAGSRGSLLVGAIATVSLAVLGSRGEADALPWVVGALVLALLVFRIVGVEAGWVGIDGTTSDLGGTVTAAGLVGVLGAHVTFVRAVPLVGFDGVLAFGVMLAAQGLGGVLGRLGGRRRIAEDLDPSLTWAAAVGGVLAAACAGLVVGILLDRPFTPAWGAALGAATGAVVPVGRAAVGAVKRGAGLSPRAGYIPGLGGVLDLSAGPLLAAPVFHWLFRTLIV